MDIAKYAPLARVALRQDGLFTRAQARAAGVRGRTLDQWVRDQQLTEPQPRVYAASTHPLGMLQHERAALLAAGPRAVLSHDNAAHRWDFDVPAPRGVWLTMPFASSPPRLEGVEVMRSRHLSGMWCLRGGVRVTTPARTWVDLGRTRTEPELEAALARGLQRRAFTLDDVDAVLAVAHNRAGTQSVRRVLKQYEPEWESVLGAAFARLMAEAGIDLEAGHVLEHDGRHVAVLDFCDRTRRIAFEVDGWYYHGSKAQQQRDRFRDRTLLGLGWVTVRFTTEDVLLRPEQVVAEVRSLLRANAA